MRTPSVKSSLHPPASPGTVWCSVVTQLQLVGDRGSTRPVVNHRGGGARRGSREVQWAGLKRKGLGTVEGWRTDMESFEIPK